METCWVDGNVPRIDDAAEIRIRAKLAALFSTWHHVPLDLQSLGLIGHTVCQRLIARRVVRRVEPSDATEIAVDAFRGDEITDPCQRIVAFLDDAKGTLCTVFPRQVIVAR